MLPEARKSDLEMSGSHLAPVLRLVCCAWTHVKCVPDAFLPECLAEAVVAFKKEVSSAYCQADVKCSQVLENVRIGQIRNEMVGRVKINIHVVMPAEQVRIPCNSARKVVAAA